MGVNKHKAHVWVIPEDDANRQLANGFVLSLPAGEICIDIRPASGGWPKVLDQFVNEHAKQLRQYRLRHLVLLIDFDDQVAARMQHFKNKFPDDIAERVYLLGTRSEPEALKSNIGRSLEHIGQMLADACANDDNEMWNHALLTHNLDELARLTAAVKPFLFAAPRWSRAADWRDDASRCAESLELN